MPDSSRCGCPRAYKALLSAGPWTVCFLSYSLLHWTYPVDRERARADDGERKGNERPVACGKPSSMVQALAMLKFVLKAIP